MRQFYLALALILLSLAALSNRISLAADSDIRLFMPDGQLRSNPVRLFITHDITAAMAPQLRLIASHAVTKPYAEENAGHQPMVVAPDQIWAEVIGGAEVRHTGTLFLFDLSNFPMPWYKAMMRLTPVVTWMEDGQMRQAVGERAVNLGNAVTAWLAAILLITILFGFIAWLAWQRHGSLHPLCDPDGSLSISQLQVAAWTLAVGSVVFGHSLIRLEVPDIPETLIALMGLSLATGGISYLRDLVAPQSAGDTNVIEPSSSVIAAATPATARVDAAVKSATGYASTPANRLSALGDLIINDGEFSLPKAQMLFWTVLMLLIFVAKSVLNGIVWEVPWEMVALMGLSQVGYLAPKLMPPRH